MKEFFSSLTWVDYVTFVALVRGAYVGYSSGFFQELLRSVNYVLCVVAALLFSERVAQYLTLKTFLDITAASVISFTAILFVVFIVGKILRIFLAKLVKTGKSGFLDRLIGTVAGMARWVVLLSFLFFVIEKSPLEQLKSDIHVKSYTGEKISKIAPLVYDYLSKASRQVEVAETLPLPEIKEVAG